MNTGRVSQKILITGSSFASLGRADRGSAPEPPKTAPSGARGLSAAKGKAPRGAGKVFTDEKPCFAPFAPSALLRDVPLARRPPLRFGLLRGGLASGRAALPRDVGRLFVAFHAGNSSWENGVWGGSPIQRDAAPENRFAVRGCEDRREGGFRSRGRKCCSESINEASRRT